MRRKLIGRKVIGGFTLLEVLVAIAILSLSLVAILSSQGAAIRTGALARSVSTGTFLARCKMAEVEEAMARDGFNVTGEHGEDECCEGGEQEGFVCSWSVEPVVLPDSLEMGEDPMAAAAPGGLGAEPGAGGLGEADMMSALAGGGGDAMASMALQFSYPVLRPMIEAQVRRATVTVRWRSGLRPASGSGPCEEGEMDCLSVSQYLVAEQGAAAPTEEAPPVEDPPAQ